MSVALTPDEGMAYLLAKIEAGTLKAKLYIGGTTYNESTVYSGLGTEASFPGYAAVTVSWGSITVDGSHIASNVAVTITWTRNSSSGSPETVTGWAIVDEANSKIECCRNPGSQVFTNAGDNFSITVTASLQAA